MISKLNKNSYLISNIFDWLKIELSSQDRDGVQRVWAAMLFV